MDFFDILLAKKLGDGREPTIEGLSVTENGIYSEENKAYNPVIVEVPAPTLISKTITANGTYTASEDNADGYSQVTVAVDGFKKKSIANTPTDIASFNDGTANPMPSLEISIEPQQDLHGYDYPWVGGAGKNLLKNEYDGMAFASVGDDGSITLNGTISVVTWIHINDNVTLKAGTYTLSGTPLNPPNGLYVYDDGSFGFGGNWADYGGRGVTRTIPEDKTGRILLRVPAGTYNNLKIYPMLESGSSKTDFEPYSNICPISGHTEANVTVTDDLITPTETHTLSIPFHDNSDNPITVYGGTLNVTSGELTATHANIASYNGETINEPWISSMDTYSAGTTPTTGAQVVYPLATPQTYQLTPAQVSTLLGQNNIFADCGQVLEGEYFVTL